MMIIEIIFVVLICLIAHSYFFYPLILMVLKKRSTAIDRTGNFKPSISIVISAYNEEKIIRDRVKNLLNLNYPKEKIQILIGSDGSQDDTDKIIQEFNADGVNLVPFPVRRGKAFVVNDLVRYAKNDIIIFSDANTFFDSDAINNFVRHFVDKSVGGVCGYLQLRSEKWNSGGKGETFYWELENIVKELEGSIYTTFGATGAIYSVRSNLFVPLPLSKAVADDFYIPMRIIDQGFRVIYDREVKSWENTTSSSTKEFLRKVRIGAANFNCLGDFKHLLNPKKGFISFGLFSHKYLRWFVPFILVITFLLNLFLTTESPLFQQLFSLQLIFLSFAIIGYLLDLISFPIRIFTFPYYFLLANIALLVGFTRSVRGSEKSVWNPTR